MLGTNKLLFVKIVLKKIVQMLFKVMLMVLVAILFLYVLSLIAQSTNDCYSANPCLNNGVCVSEFLDNAYSCNCPLMYFGDHCEMCRCFAKNNTCSTYGESVCNFKHKHIEPSLTLRIFMEKTLRIMFIQSWIIALIVLHRISWHLDYKITVFNYEFIKKLLREMFKKQTNNTNSRTVEVNFIPYDLTRIDQRQQSPEAPPSYTEI